MTLTWTREDSPRWDADKQRLFGPAELASAGLAAPEPDAAIADEWWRVEDPDGSVLGYGWLDSEWGDARISFLVGAEARGVGVGDFILDRLEAESATRGVNYIYNIIPTGHPDREWLAHWLQLHGFHAADRGELRRQVRRRPSAGAVSVAD